MRFKRFICGFLAVLLLLADCGQMVYAHTCLKSGRTTFSISGSGSCCTFVATDNKCSFKKASCCQVTAKYAKQPLANRIQLVREFKSALPFFVVNEFFKVFVCDLFYPAEVSSNPPLPCKSDICFTGIFRC